MPGDWHLRRLPRNQEYVSQDQRPLVLHNVNCMISRHETRPSVLAAQEDLVTLTGLDTAILPVLIDALLAVAP